MHNRWQPLLVMALVLTAFNFHNNSAAEQPATTTTTTTTSQPPTATSQPPTATTPSTTTSTTKPPTATTPTTTTSTTNPPGGQDQPGGGGGGGEDQGGEDRGPAEQAGRHRVVPGDNLWTIARDHLAEIRGRRAADLSDREIAAYWRKVIAANVKDLESGDPDLIYPGERIVLPPVD